MMSLGEFRIGSTSFKLRLADESSLPTCCSVLALAAARAWPTIAHTVACEHVSFAAAGVQGQVFIEHREQRKNRIAPSALLGQLDIAAKRIHKINVGC